MNGEEINKSLAFHMQGASIKNSPNAHMDPTIFQSPIGQVVINHFGREDKESDAEAVKALQQALAQKEAEISGFLDNAEVESKDELVTALKQAQQTPGKFQQKKIQDAQEKLDALALLESQKESIKNQIAALTRSAEINPEVRGKHVNNAGARIKGQFNDRVQAEEMDFTSKDEEEASPQIPVTPNPTKQHLPGVIDNTDAHIKGQFNALVTAKIMRF